MKLIDEIEITLNSKETMAFLNISRTTLNKLLREKKIKNYSMTSKLLFFKSDLLEALKSNFSKNG